MRPSKDGTCTSQSANPLNKEKKEESDRTHTLIKAWVKVGQPPLREQGQCCRGVRARQQIGAPENAVPVAASSRRRPRMSEVLSATGG